ncbi:MAG TPA: nitronate monooxygenase [Polyangiaceae bacterium]|nr:nitronate monooxygenase [Polyangiaceae bacterium]
MSQRHCLESLHVQVPVIQAPMAGAQDEELACAVALAGGLGSLPCAMLTPAGIAEQVENFRRRVAAPLNLNFFCHTPPPPSLDALSAWRQQLDPYYRELGVSETKPTAGRRPFDEEMCRLVEQLRPEVVSFHFGLPEASLLTRVRASGAMVLGSATSVAEAHALVAGGVHAVIAQGAEAGGHRGTFLAEKADDAELGLFALLPQIVDAVKLPVIAAGGIADARGVAAAQALGASAVQVGSAYLRCRESRIGSAHRRALEQARDDSTRISDVFTGRRARGIVNRFMREMGPNNDLVPPFPLASSVLAPVRAHAEGMGSGDFSPLWAGQAVALPGGSSDANVLTKLLGSGWR